MFIFILFKHKFYRKTVDASGIRTRIVGANKRFMLLIVFCYQKLIFREKRRSKDKKNHVKGGEIQTGKCRRRKSFKGFVEWGKIVKNFLQPVWPDWVIYWTLGTFLKPLATINLPKSPTFLGYFCQGVKIYHFWATFINIWRFFLVTLLATDHTMNN